MTVFSIFSRKTMVGLLISGLLLGSSLNVGLFALSPYELGVQAFRSHQYENSLVYLRQASMETPNDANIHYYMGITADALHRNADALSQFDYVIDHAEDQAVESDVLTHAKQRALALRQELSANEADYLAPRSEQDKPEPKVDKSHSHARVSINLSGRALTLNAKLNNQVTGNFILDTGATYTSISRDMAQELGIDLVHSSHINITTANGRISVPKVIIKHIKINGVEANNVEATVIDLNTHQEFSGLLGLSFIKKFKLTIDPAQNQLTFEKVASETI